MKIIKKIFPALAAILSLSGCGNEIEEPVDMADDISAQQNGTLTVSEDTEKSGSDTTEKDVTEAMAEPVSKSAEEEGAYASVGSEFAAPIAEMTKDMLADYAQTNDSGMISGYSAYSALMYVYPFASGKTSDEIGELLGQPDVRNFRDSQPVRPEKADDDEMAFFGEEPPQFYTSGLFIVDDRTVLNTDDTSDFVIKNLHEDSIVPYINDYISENTNKLIPSIISSPFDDDCRAVILDTLYFKASWANKFSEGKTEKDTFYGRDKETSVDFMNQQSFFNVYDDIIRLKYRDTPIVMDIVKDIEDVETGFDYYLNSCGELADPNSEHDTILKLPKFTAETSVDLKDTLAAMGLSSAFTNDADFSKLADDLFISDIIQKTKIAVDEIGTEAAAATMVVSKATGAPNPNVQPLEFIVNKPFLYILKNTETDEILFAGYYYNF